MAGIKISDLPPAPSVTLTDVYPADQGPVTYKESLQQVMTLFENNIVITPANFSGTLPVANGGTGNNTYTAFSVITAGTTATGSFQNVVGLGNAGQQLTSNGPGLLPTWQASGGVTPSALTETDDTNVTLTLTGTPATALLQAVNVAVGWAGQLSLARGGTNANLTASNGGIFYSTATAGAILSGTATALQMLQSGANSAPTWSTATFASTYAASSFLYSNGANAVVGLATANNGLPVTGNTGVPVILAGPGATGRILTSNIAAAPTWTTAAFPSTAGTAGNLMESDGTNWVSTPPAALTKTDDTNVTLTLTGSPTTALVNAANVAAGWTGQLSLTRGGTAASLTASNGGIFYSTASAGAILAGTATAGLALLSGATAPPTWSTSPPITQVVIQTFTSTGTYTPTSGMKYCIIECLGGGAAGGSAASTAVNYGNGGGGGGGGYSRFRATSASIGASKAVTIGSGGSAGAAGFNPGGNGGDTSVGTLCIGKGGTGGQGGTTNALALGGAGGVSGTGDFVPTGPSGFSGLGVVSGVLSFSGQGASSLYGSGGLEVSSGGGTGNAGANYASGGSGGSSFNGANVQGGAGSAGVVIITEYIST